MWRRDDIHFTNENQCSLQKAGAFNKKLVRVGTPTGPYKVEWKQILKQVIGNASEDYYICKFAEAGDEDGKEEESGLRGRHCWDVFIATKVGIDTINQLHSFHTSGVDIGGDCVLHFGFKSLTTNRTELYFVIHPNKWAPFQKRFRGVLGANNYGNSTLTWAAGFSASAATDTALKSYVGGAALVASSNAEIPIAIAVGTMNYVGKDLCDRFVGRYLRYIGPGDGIQEANIQQQIDDDWIEIST